eukprot:comp27639_c0_seq1/m.47168 comp27639_c0_seq1/g.47168  ORF comp27639_c0_seq1/g.47168 comp27639_c0_seq1/m.47168 type:complete len:359 (-) comp27639_c0_seq1:353-1429(-)
MTVAEFDFSSILRPNLRHLQPYRCARDDYEEGILLDANENSFGAAIEPDENELNRYPDPHQKDLKKLIAEFRGISPDEIFVGVGSDEAIDLLIRIVCVPGKDSIMITPPTYGMYKVSANINDAAVQCVPLTEDFQLRVDEMLKAVTPQTKLIFLCSPGNPTANCLSLESIEEVCKGYKTGLVVLDEAYVDFSPEGSHAALIRKYPNLVVLQTMSKSFGLAAIRLGMAFGPAEIVSVLNKVKAPYNVNKLTSQVALQAFTDLHIMRNKVQMLLEQRAFMEKELAQFPTVRKIYPSHANFLLIRIDNSLTLYKTMAESGIVVRYRGSEIHCTDCLRITIGTPEENIALLKLLKETIANLK